MPLSRVLSDSDEIWSIPFLPWVQMVPVGEKRAVSCYITSIHQGAGLQTVQQRCDSGIQTAYMATRLWLETDPDPMRARSRIPPQRFLCSSHRLPLREALKLF